MITIPALVAHVFSSDATNPAARLVHIALASIADENGHVETTVHTIERMTGLLPSAVEIVLGHNHLNHPLIPVGVSLVDGVIAADLTTGA